MCDYQNMILAMLPPDVVPGLLTRAASVISACRTAGVSVIYVKVCFRPGQQEIAFTNKTFSRYKLAAANTVTEGSPPTDIHATVAPADSDAIVIKRRVSAFHGTDLDVLLSALQTRHLIIMGLTTGGVVLNTVRQAADRDFVLSVVSDCCTDRDVEVHDVLMNKVFINQAQVVTSAELIDRLKAN